MDKLTSSVGWSKRGESSIVMLVAMVFVLFCVTLAYFLVHSGTREKSIGDAQYAEGVLYKEDQIRWYLRQAGEEAYKEAYREVVSRQKITRLGDLESEETRAFFYERFGSALEASLKKITFSDSSLGDFAGKISQKHYLLDFNKGAMRVVFNDAKIEGSWQSIKKQREWVWGIIPTPYTSEDVTSQMGVVYRPKIEVKISAEEVGLQSFEDISQSVEGCWSEKDEQQCLREMLPLFEVNSGKGERGRYYTLATKTLFEVDGKQEPLRIEFSE